MSRRRPCRTGEPVASSDALTGDDDAAVLAEEIGATTHRSDLADALQRYRNRRLARSAAVQAGNLSAAKALRGTVLDIILVPAEDETLYAQPLDGEPAYYYGMVGDALREIGGREPIVGELCGAVRP